MRTDNFSNRRGNGSPDGVSCSTCRFFFPLERGTNWPRGECRISSKRANGTFPKADTITGWCGRWVQDPSAPPAPDYITKTRAEPEEERRRREVK